MWAFALILALPLIEIGLFVSIGGAIGLWPTLGFVFSSAVIGFSILRQGGLRNGMARPAQRSGLMMQIAGQGMTMVAALLLIMPGFLTSALGAMLLLPPVQNAVVWALRQRFGMTFVATETAADTHDANIIDAEYEVVPPREGRQAPPSRWTQD